MYKFTKNRKIDFDKYEKYLRNKSYIVYDRERMQNTVKYEVCHEETLASLAIDTMIYNSNGACTQLTRPCILTYLMDYENCPERYFYNHKVAGASLDAGKVLTKLVNNGHAVDFLKDYMHYKSLQSKNGKVKGIVQDHRESAGVNKDGIPITKLYFQVNQQKNLRYNYKNSDIIAIPKEYNDCITVDEDYFLAWGDFGQSDFRIAYNLFMRSPENDKIMNAYDDKYEALARMVASFEGQSFDYDKFKEERQLYKKLTLATVYGTRDSVIAAEQPFIKRMTEFLYKCDKYVEYEKRLKDRIALKLPLVVNSYFGNEQPIAGKYRDVDLLNDALNAPVQTGTSEIVILVTMQILEEFYKLGYTEEEVNVYYVRHDEPIFRIHKKALKDIWILNQFSEILIDDWTPLKLDFDFGYYYKQSDEELSDIVQKVYTENSDKIEKIAYGTTINDFYPIAPICNLIVEKCPTPDGKIIYAVYAPDIGAVMYKLLNEELMDDTEYVLSLIKGIEPAIYSNGYRGISVKASFLSDNEAFFGKSYVGVKNINNHELVRASILARYMMCRYCKAHALEYDINLTPLAQDEEFINSIRDMGDVLKGDADAKHEIIS